MFFVHAAYGQFWQPTVLLPLNQKARSFHIFLMKRFIFLEHKCQKGWQKWVPESHGPSRTRPLGGRRRQTSFHFGHKIYRLLSLLNSF